jgi:hypothetical protein
VWKGRASGVTLVRRCCGAEGCVVGCTGGSLSLWLCSENAFLKKWVLTTLASLRALTTRSSLGMPAIKKTADKPTDAEVRANPVTWSAVAHCADAGETRIQE